MNRKTNFENVSEFNELIGNAKGAATVDQVEKQFELIESEFEELRKGILALKIAAHLMASPSEDDRDQGEFERDLAIKEIRDGIADVLVTTYGLAHRMGIDADKDMEAVATSNDSKFFRGTEEEAATVCENLAGGLGIKVEAHATGNTAYPTHPPKYVWAFVSADDSDPERPRGKLLKAPGYKPPVFS